MDIDKVKRKVNKEKRSIMVSLRVTPSVSKWMTKHDISPSRVFDEAVDILMRQTQDEVSDEEMADLTEMSGAMYGGEDE